MGKVAAPKRRTSYADSDPALDYLAAFDARAQLVGAGLSIGWRLAVMVLLPLFIGVQLDRRFDSSPSLTLAAFFIAIFGAGMLIYRTYQEYVAQAAEAEAAKSKRKPKKGARTK